MKSEYNKIVEAYDTLNTGKIHKYISLKQLYNQLGYSKYNYLAVKKFKLMMNNNFNLLKGHFIFQAASIYVNDAEQYSFTRSTIPHRTYYYMKKRKEQKNIN